MPTGTTKLHLYRLSRVLSAGRGHPRGEPHALEPKTQRTGGLTGRGQVAVLDSVYRRADPMLVAGFAGKPSFARWLAAVMTSPRHGPSILGAASDAHGPLRCRPLAIRAFRQLRWRRRITVFLAMAVLLAGLAQAAHYHRDNLARGSTDVHCLLCLFAASSATPPLSARAVPPRAPCFCRYRSSVTDAGPLSSEAALYDARGPPAA